jgi:ATP-dependent DNA ligase
MKKEKLQDIMRFYKIAAPMRGTGRGGRVTNDDLQRAIGDYFYKEKFEEGNKFSAEDARHMRLRRRFQPMKAYRFNNLKSHEQERLFDDNNGWIAEKKEDGWRMLLTHIPGDRLHVFGGNLSTTEFLPVDYTYHLPAMKLDVRNSFVLDCEAICEDQVLTQEGFPTTNTREAVAAILGSGAELAVEIQKEAIVKFICFDVWQPEEKTLSARKKLLSTLDFEGLPIEAAKYHATTKKRFLNRIWKEGGEGVILKNVSAEYDSGGRKRTHAIKVKKSASGLIGDTIDAFITGFVRTEVHSFNDLIGGVELSVMIDGEQQPIAIVSNMPDYMRYKLTEIEKGLPVLAKDAYFKVLEIDGQEFSTRNRRLMHATVASWEFRQDKSPEDCIMEEVDFGGKF